jgi:hypothetical protein
MRGGASLTKVEESGSMMVVWHSLWVVEMGAETEAQRIELWSLIREVQLLACASMLPTLSAPCSKNDLVLYMVCFSNHASILRPFLQPTMRLPVANCIKLAGCRH